MVESDDPLLFPNDDGEAPRESINESATALEPWRVLVVDDEPQVHAITRLAIANLEVDGHPLELISAFTGKEAREVLQRTDNIALVLLDVVMENEHAGLSLARWIRETLRDHLIRLVLRTGQPGTAPEQQVMLEYDINDYRPKTELTAQRLVTTILGAIRSYRDLCVINAQKRGLQRVVDASATLFQRLPFEEFIRGLLDQISAMLQPRRSAIFVQVRGPFFGLGDEPTILAGTGRFHDAVGRAMSGLLNKATRLDMATAIRSQQALHRPGYSIFGLCYRSSSWAALYVETTTTLSSWENRLLEVFCHNAAVALDNLRLHHRQLDLLASFERFVPTQLLELAEIEDVTDARVGDHIQRDVSVVFADLRSFTSLAEALSPSDTFAFINDFFGAIVPAIQEHGGVVDKYMGDGLMALFSNTPGHAVRAGLAMLNATRRFAKEHRYNLPLAPEIGVGVHTGPIILGLVGAADRLEFTGISDGVNIAARVERLTRILSADLLISEAIYSALPADLQAQSRPLGETEIRGKDRGVEVYEVFAADAPEERTHKAATKEALAIVAAAIRERRWQDARDDLALLRRQHPKDRTLATLDRQCRRRLLLASDATLAGASP